MFLPLLHGSGSNPRRLHKRAAFPRPKSGQNDSALTPEQSSFIDSCVETGRYQSASEVIRAGLRLLADQEAIRLAELEAVRSLIKTGAESI